MHNKEWYKEWFNSPYYHILYKNRDYKEAAQFIDKLFLHFNLSSKDKVWDLACGKGRHAIYLSKKGIRVTGTDLSLNNINCANDSSDENVNFFVHDMRQPFQENDFTHVFNLFTSIGYFENKNENLKVFNNVFQSLKPGGFLVIDFFNSEKVLNELPVSEKKETDGITFNIIKKQKENRIVKHIEVKDNFNSYFFEEWVSLLSFNDFLSFGKASGFTLLDVFGDYDLNAFDKLKSERLILIFKK